MNEATKLAIRERINVLAGELITLERTRHTGADLLIGPPARIFRIEDEIEELNEDLNEPEEDDEEEGDRTLGTYYVNIEPRVEKVREVLEELSKLSSDKPKYA